MRVTVFHNEDAGFCRGYEPGDRLTKVHETEVVQPFDAAETNQLLEGLYNRYNIGEDADALAYRGIRVEKNPDGTLRQYDDGSGKATIHNGIAYGIRSLSVGDVLVLGEVAYTVASFGFDRVDLVAPGLVS